MITPSIILGFIILLVAIKVTFLERRLEKLEKGDKL